MAEEVIRRYCDAFNAMRWDEMLALLTDDVAHYPNQGALRTGKDAFAAFLAEMDRAYVERIEDLVILVDPSGARAAAEFTIRGTYRATQAGLPEATGQTYALPVGSFFALRGGLIARVTTYYNMQDWLRQVAA